MVIVRWGAWLSFNADVVGGTDGDAGVSRPTDTNDWDEGGGHFIFVAVVSRHHLLLKESETGSYSPQRP